MSPTKDVTVSGQPVFSPVNHPELRRLGRKPVHDFLHQREKYLLRVKDAQNAGSQITPVSLRSSIDKDLLESLISLNAFKHVTTFEELTDDILDTFLHARDGTKIESISLQDLESSVKYFVKINVHEPDAEMRIMSLFSDYRNHLRQKKWERLIEESPKTAIQHVVCLLRPPILRNKMEQGIIVNVNDVRKDWLKFYEKIIKRALEVDEYIPITSDCTGDCKNHKSHNPDRSSKRHQKGHKEDNSTVTPGTTSKPGKGKYPGSRQSTASPSKSDDLPPCLNTECEDRHYLKDYKDTPDEKKKELLRKYYEARRKACMSTFVHSLSQPSVDHGRKMHIRPPQMNKIWLYQMTIGLIIQGQVSRHSGMHHQW